jgi:hypothetical protein
MFSGRVEILDRDKVSKLKEAGGSGSASTWSTEMRSSVIKSCGER